MPRQTRHRALHRAPRRARHHARRRPPRPPATPARSPRRPLRPRPVAPHRHRLGRPLHHCRAGRLRERTLHHPARRVEPHRPLHDVTARRAARGPPARGRTSGAVGRLIGPGAPAAASTIPVTVPAGADAAPCSSPVSIRGLCQVAKLPAKSPNRATGCAPSASTRCSGGTARHPGSGAGAGGCRGGRGATAGDGSADSAQPGPEAHPRHLPRCARAFNLLISSTNRRRSGCSRSRMSSSGQWKW